MVSVPDSEIAATILHLLEREKQVVEPAGAAALAAALCGAVKTTGNKAVCLLSGGNIDVGFIHRIIERGLLTRGRLLKFKTTMLDTPGSLEKFARFLGQTGANIVMVQHDRQNMDLDLNEAILHIACEVSGFEHGELVTGELRRAGYRIIKE
jgi:threonine dehydratase